MTRPRLLACLLLSDRKCYPTPLIAATSGELAVVGNYGVASHLTCRDIILGDTNLTITSFQVDPNAIAFFH